MPKLWLYVLRSGDPLRTEYGTAQGTGGGCVPLMSGRPTAVTETFRTNSRAGAWEALKSKCDGDFGAVSWWEIAITPSGRFGGW